MSDTDARNPFDQLGLDPEFDLDLDQLETVYLQQSAEAHPDRHPDPADQAEAADRAARINEAYRTLKDPESRANALLAIHGGAAREEDTSLPPDLLMEVMEQREAIEAAREGNDDAELDRLIGEATERRRARLETIGELFGAVETADDPTATLEKIREQLNALRYDQRLLDQEG